MQRVCMHIFLDRCATLGLEDIPCETFYRPALRTLRRCTTRNLDTIDQKRRRIGGERCAIDAVTRVSFPHHHPPCHKGVGKLPQRWLSVAQSGRASPPAHLNHRKHALNRSPALVCRVWRAIRLWGKIPARNVGLSLFGSQYGSSYQWNLFGVIPAHDDRDLCLQIVKVDRCSRDLIAGCVDDKALEKRGGDGCLARDNAHCA